MRWRRHDESYEFRELGSLEFTRLCVELLAREAGFATTEWREHPFGQAALAEGSVRLGDHRALQPPTLVVIAWIGDGYLRSRREGRAPLGAARGAWPATSFRSVLMLTNARADALSADDRAETVILGRSELTALVRESAETRLHSPSVLGVCRLDELIDEGVERRSSGDFAAARDLSLVFVPTRAYATALAALERYHFAFLTGPPEMGKTAIARMVGLAKQTAGWEMHECIRPADLWQRYARDRRQVFVADDAFGSTEYRPEAAERWAVELDRVLRSMDEWHWLLWTSRPAPLKAALRRIHREHGVERFPAPAQVQVDAASLEVAEKALILYRHGRAARLSAAAIALVRAHGWHIVDHPHFTPERIRRLVASRLRPGDTAFDPTQVGNLVELQIREPTPAMTESFAALAPEHRAVLVAMLDTPPGPVTERELVSTVRRHLHELHARAPRELIDRLTDHFLRLVEPASVTWVHPSWRDLVIEQLATDSRERQAFLRDCGLEGIVLALSTGGGAAGERALPLLVADRDWDLIGDRIASLLPDLDDPATVRLTTALAEARAVTSERQAAELEALAGLVLEQLRLRWNAERQAIPVGLLAVWFELAAQLPQRVPPPELGPTWIEHVPTLRVDAAERSDLARFDDWVALAALLRKRHPQALATFGFPERQAAIINRFIVDAQSSGETETPPSRDLLVSLLERLADLVPECALDARPAAERLRAMPAESQFEPSRHPPRQISDELRAILDAPAARQHPYEEIVARVLRDL